jgi:HD-GYP domain-containing protein (c-di-GMP phosphodiesterase class II)
VTVQNQPRLAELIGSLSLATDVVAGLAMETAIRTCILATELARELGADAAPLRDVYYTALLRFIGCSAFSHEVAQYGGGDDLAFMRAMTPVDPARPATVLTALAKIGKGGGATNRIVAVTKTLLDPQAPKKLAVAHCDLAVRLGVRLGMSEGVLTALGQIYERFDASGFPAHLAGERIAIAARVMHVAWRAEVHRGLEGSETAKQVVRERRGNELDPAIADAFLRRADDLLALVDAPSVWETFLSAEPAPVGCVAPSRVDEVATAFAHYVDIKTPYTLGHSTAVARLADAAASGFSEPERASLHTAALLHDLGNVSLPNGIWNKRGALNALEWERVHQHTYHTERILSRSPLFAPYAQIAASHHERPDGSGYHRGLNASRIPPLARVLAAADAYQAMTEARAYRPALSPSEAARALQDDTRAGRFDRDAAESVLTAAGASTGARVAAQWPASLSDREVEVLCQVARGLTNKQVARALKISDRTVQHHLAHVFEKTGVSTRAAAAVFAVENGLID